MFVVLHEFLIEVARVVQLREVKRLVHIAHLVNDVALVAQLYDERIRVLSQQLHIIECGLEHIVVEIVDDVLGHIENGKSDEEWLLHLAYWCIQLDADQILGVHQSSLHEFSIGGVCQQLVEVLLHSGLGLGSFLTQHVDVFEDERCLFESNESIVNVNNFNQVLRPFAHQ